MRSLGSVRVHCQVGFKISQTWALRKEGQVEAVVDIEIKPGLEPW